MRKAADPSPQASPELRPPLTDAELLGQLRLCVHEFVAFSECHCPWGPDDGKCPFCHGTELLEELESRVTAPVGQLVEADSRLTDSLADFLQRTSKELARRTNLLDFAFSEMRRISEEELRVNTRTIDSLNSDEVQGGGQVISGGAYRPDTPLDRKQGMPVEPLVKFLTDYAEKQFRNWSAQVGDYPDRQSCMEFWRQFKHYVETGAEAYQATALASPPQIAQPEVRISALELAIATFKERRGKHEGDHDSAHTACSKCELAYIEAEQELDKAIAR